MDPEEIDQGVTVGEQPKKKDPEVDTDEGNLVDDEFAESLGYYKADYEKAKQHRKETMIRDENDEYYPF